MRRELEKGPLEVKSGSPVTNVILTERKREAEERGIAFSSRFHCPEGVGAFDLCVILDNAILNALEAADGCEAPFLRVCSYRRKNACLLEFANNFQGELHLNESGLPEISRPDRERHGLGLSNIRRTAQKYHGDIDIQLHGSTFVLRVMLMVEQTRFHTRKSPFRCIRLSFRKPECYTERAWRQSAQIRQIETNQEEYPMTAGIGNTAMITAMMSANTALMQAQTQGSVRAGLNEKARVLETGIKLDGGRGDEEGAARKQEELTRIQQAEQDAAVSQTGALSKAGEAIKKAAEAPQDGEDTENTVPSAGRVELSQAGEKEAAEDGKTVAELPNPAAYDKDGARLPQAAGAVTFSAIA